jgi:hypothetical protein
MFMKKMCVILVIVISIGLSGCKKSPPVEPKPAQPAVTQNQPATEQTTPAVEQTAADAQKATQETAQKATESAKPATEQVKQALTAAAAEIDLASPIDTLKAQAKQMNVDALKATAEKYKAQFLSTKTDWTTKTDLLAKIPTMEKLGPEAQALTKEIQTLTSSLASLKERMTVYVDALKAKGVDISSFTL